MDFHKKLHSSDLKPNNDDIHELLNIIIRPHLTQDQVDTIISWWGTSPTTKPLNLMASLLSATNISDHFFLHFS